ncbi:MAG: HAD family hydrolase [Candidatus Dormibacteraceae bacterium]
MLPSPLSNPPQTANTLLEHLFLDWNGTLFSDTWAAVIANNELFKVLGVRPISKTDWQATFEIPIINFYLHHGCSLEKMAADPASLQQLFSQSYEPLADRCRTRRGARQLLSWLGENKIRRLLLSNHTEPEIIAQLKRLRLINSFEVLTASQELSGVIVEATKEAKLAAHLKTTTSPKKRIAIIGDAPEEVEIGRRAGIWTIAITGGFYSTSRLRACHPDFLVDSLPAALAVLQELHAID